MLDLRKPQKNKNKRRNTRVSSDPEDEIVVAKDSVASDAVPSEDSSEYVSHVVPFSDGIVNSSFGVESDIIPKMSEANSLAYSTLCLCEAYHTCIVKVRYKPSYMKARSSGRLLGGSV